MSYAREGWWGGGESKAEAEAKLRNSRYDEGDRYRTW
jgi:hypothetical protein